MTQEGQTITRRAQAAPIVLGAVAFGKPKPTTRDHPLSSDESCDNLLKLFYERGGAGRFDVVAPKILGGFSDRIKSTKTN